MAIRDFSQFLLYRWRYIIGYSFIGLLLAGMLVFAGLFVPGGITTEEKQSVVTSEALNIDDLSTFVVPHLPYHLMQATSLEVFGINEFTIKLPSLILGLLAAIGLIVLLRRWFRPNIAVLTSLIAVATGQFLFISQSGTPTILYMFWPILLLLLGTQITRGKRFRLLWKFLFTAVVALSLYSPLTFYPLLAVMVTIALHPHLRNAVRRLPKLHLSLAIVLALAIITPLAFMVSRQPELGLILLGVPAVEPNLLANAQTLIQQYFIFWDPQATSILMPVFGLGSTLLIALGIHRLYRTRETTRSYLIICWIVALFPVLLFNPDFTAIIFVPSVFLLAAGLTSLITYWYRLFPLNPYARLSGLIPLVVLVVALLGAGLDRYVYGYHYSPSAASYFSRDLSLLPKDAERLIVSEDEASFYQAVSAYREGLVVSTETPEAPYITTRAARPNETDLQITRIITNDTSENADRFYQYQNRSE